MGYNDKTITYEEAPEALGLGTHNVKFNVTYNGQTESWIDCDIPIALEQGKVYKITKMDVHNCQTFVTLEGVAGKFNSVWFEETSE